MKTYIEVLKSLFMEKRLYCCQECGDLLDDKVWHCRKCHHHWWMTESHCGNCHKQKRTGAPVSELVTDFSQIENPDVT